MKNNTTAATTNTSDLAYFDPTSKNNDNSFDDDFNSIYNNDNKTPTLPPPFDHAIDKKDNTKNVERV